MFDLALSIIIAPLLETFIFTTAFHALDRILSNRRRFPSFMIGIMTVIGWGAHGASFLSLNRALPFGLLGYLYARRTERSGELQGFAVTALAHGVWNGLILGAAALYQGLR